MQIEVKIAGGPLVFCKIWSSRKTRKALEKMCEGKLLEIKISSIQFQLYFQINNFIATIQDIASNTKLHFTKYYIYKIQHQYN